MIWFVLLLVYRAAFGRLSAALLRRPRAAPSAAPRGAESEALRGRACDMRLGASLLRDVKRDAADLPSAEARAAWLFLPAADPRALRPKDALRARTGAPVFGRRRGDGRSIVKTPGARALTLRP